MEVIGNIWNWVFADTKEEIKSQENAKVNDFKTVHFI